MRNLSQEAAQLAEESLITQDRRLADPMFRKNLPPVVKQQLFMQLVSLGEMYEVMLIENIRQGIYTETQGMV